MWQKEWGVMWPLCIATSLIQKPVWGCAVCGVATEASRQAFMYSTAFLSLIPLLMIGGIAYYLFWLNRHNQN
jgi:hypothetical protein